MDITDRQLLYVDLAAKGYFNKEIADKLGVSVRTVNSMLDTVRKKTKSPNTTNAVYKLTKEGFL